MSFIKLVLAVTVVLAVCSVGSGQSESSSVTESEATHGFDQANSSTPSFSTVTGRGVAIRPGQKVKYVLDDDDSLGNHSFSEVEKSEEYEQNVSTPVPTRQRRGLFDWIVGKQHEGAENSSEIHANGTDSSEGGSATSGTSNSSTVSVGTSTFGPRLNFSDSFKKHPFFKRSLLSVNESENATEAAKHYDVCVQSGIEAVISDVSEEIKESNDDPKEFTVYGYDCYLYGFSNIVVDEVNCTNDGDNTTVHNGEFVFPKLNATCRCDMTNSKFAWLANMSAENVPVHSTISKSSNDTEFEFFRAVYPIASEVIAPSSDDFEFGTFSYEFNKVVRSQFSAEYVKTVSRLLQAVSQQL